MKNVCFIRHAKSDWQDFRLSDHDRPLNERGEMDAPFMADLLYRSGLTVDGILSSTAQRAYSTALAFAEVFGIPADDILRSRDLYHSDVYEMQTQLQALPEDWQSVLLFAHNPGLTDMANGLIHAERFDNVPTCGILLTQCPNQNWSDWRYKNASIVRYFFPSQYR